MTDTEIAIMIKNMAREAVKKATVKNIKPEDMMRDCENFKSSRSCLLGKNQKEECSKNCRYYTPEKTTAKNGQLYGSSPSLDGIKKIIAQFYYGDPANYSFTETGPGTWSISGPKGIKPGVVVRKSKGRYRFEDV